jgi:hypothetical protein
MRDDTDDEHLYDPGNSHSLNSTDKFILNKTRGLPIQTKK